MSINKQIVTYLFFVFTLFLGLYFRENSSGGAKIDHDYLFPFINQMSLDLKSGILSFLNDRGSLIHSPVFSIFFGIVYKLTDNILFLQIFYIIISCTLPLIFFLILKNKFNSNKEILFLFSLIIFISPYFRSSAIWILGDNLSLIFFGLSVLFFNLTNDHKNKLIYYYLTIFFLILCCYIRYYYCIFAFYYVLIFFKNLSKRNFILLIFFSILLSVPAFMYFYFIFIKFNFMDKLNNYSNLNFYRNSLILNSIILFYLLPIIFLDSKKIFNYIIKRKLFVLSLLIFVFLIWVLDFYFFQSLENFSPNGGGVFIKLAKILDLNLAIFLSILTILLIISLEYYFEKSKITNYFLYLILIISFPVFTIYQKYFDPLFYLFFFGLICFKSKEFLVKTRKQLKFVSSFYLLFYLFSLTYYLKIL